MNAGLCETCRHAKILRNDRGSVFYMCGLAEQDKRFRRYPPLPVHKCQGYEKTNEEAPDRKPDGAPES